MDVGDVTNVNGNVLRGVLNRDLRNLGWGVGLGVNQPQE